MRYWPPETAPLPVVAHPWNRSKAATRAMADLISKKTRTEFREYFVGTTLRSPTSSMIHVPIDTDYNPGESGQRRSLVQQYYHAVNCPVRCAEGVAGVRKVSWSPWRNESSTLCTARRTKYAEKQLSLLLRCLQRDRFAYADGRITPTTHNPTIEELSETAATLDNRVLRQQIDRIRNAIGDDPDLAIGTAKELLETTCRSILADYGVTADSGWDVTRFKEARGVLKLVPEDIPDSAKGAEIIKRVLSNLGQVSPGPCRTPQSVRHGPRQGRPVQGT